ncbi:hypothetical protein HID58_047965 [Brassica napus]|uniref:Uncharacterized protein n=1 Tax=Brassica napus TaxID=3708 RepID=A0ABQ8B0U0_BRANA|nr:hypothetical protein HID58_047965 [Brassica napus]
MVLMVKSAFRVLLEVLSSSGRGGGEWKGMFGSLSPVFGRLCLCLVGGGELNSLAVNVVLGLVALARGVLLSRGVEIVVHGSFEAASSPSVHPFSSSGLVFFSGSVPPVQLLMSRLTYLRFSEKASDEESELFLVTGVWIFRWIRRLGDASQCRVLVLMVVLFSYSLAGLRALWTTSGDHPVPVFLQVWFRLQAVHESVWWSLWAL